MLLGKETRLNRLRNGTSGKMLSVAMDHGMAMGYDRLPPGLEMVPKVLPQVIEGRPDALVFQKGMAMHCLPPFAGQVPWMMQSTIFVPHITNVDHQVAYVEDAIALGADAVAMTITVGDDTSGSLAAMLGRLVREAMPVGLPVVAHIYAKGDQVPPGQEFALNWVRYAARVGVEMGADVVKVSYTGSPETFAEVVETCPVPVVAAGGPRLSSTEEVLTMVRGVMDAGATGITIGRNVWGEKHILPVMAALRAIIHQNASVAEAIETYREGLVEG